MTAGPASRSSLQCDRWPGITFESPMWEVALRRDGEDDYYLYRLSPCPKNGTIYRFDVRMVEKGV